ncbi:MAG: hypothetical protein V2A34_09195 [Lentisphaerota bacterium]
MPAKAGIQSATAIIFIIFFTRTLYVPPPVLDFQALTLRKEDMMNMAGFTSVDKWMDAILQMLLDAGVIALKEQGPSCRRAQNPGPDDHSIEWNGQMLLPGMGERYRWDFRADRRK